MNTNTGYEKGHISHDDEISLSELLLIVWRHRKIGLIVSMIPVLVALVYALVATPIYRAEMHLQPPLSQDIEELNFDVTKKEKIFQPDEVYKHFISRFHSRSLRREFFKKNELLEYFGGKVSFETTFINKFDKKLTIQTPKADELTASTLAFEFHDADKAAELLNKYVEKVQAVTVKELVANVNRNIQIRINFIEEEVRSKRKLVKERRLDSIVRMQEALNIALKLGIKKPTDFNTMSEGNNNQQDVSVNTSQMPMYTLGSIALSAEIEELKNRKSDDPYIPELRNLQEELAFLKAVIVQPDLVKVVRIDQAAIPPEHKIKPRRSLIVLIGVMLGAVLGLLTIFIVHFIRVFKEDVSQFQT